MLKIATTSSANFLEIVSKVAEFGRANIVAALVFIRAQRSDFNQEDLSDTIRAVENKGLTGVAAQIKEQYDQAKEVSIANIAKTIKASAPTSSALAPICHIKKEYSSGMSI